MDKNFENKQESKGRQRDNEQLMRLIQAWETATPWQRKKVYLYSLWLCNKDKLPNYL